MKILLDTDVILDFFFDRQPFSEDAAKILSLCESGKITGFITPVIISNLYYILKRAAPHDKVIEKLSQLIEIVDILPMNRKIVMKALQSAFKDFEDALQNFTAENHEEVKLIITRNIKDYKQSSIRVLTPSEYLHSAV
jgi:predicted nucleic acid-binding protein